MSGETLTLKHFFADGEGLAVKGEALLEHLNERVSDAGRNLAAAAIDQALHAAFNIQLGELLHRSWRQVDEFREAVEEGRHDHEAVAVIPLMEHAITTTHTPSLELFLGRKRLARMPLEIELNLLLNGVALELRGGKIAGLRSGECAGEGAVLVGGVPIVEQETPAIHLPGRLAFPKKAAH
jgi:hypothetical protein